MATSTPTLVGARAVQAVGASMLFANLAAIMMAAFRRSSEGGRWGSGHDRLRRAGHRGPLGGWLTDALGWRSVFWVNVPLGIAPWPWAGSWRRRIRRGGARPFDLAGSAVYVLGLGLLLVGLNQGPAWGWSSPATIGCLLLAGLLLAAWVVLELRISTPMIDLRLFRRRAFSAPC